MGADRIGIDDNFFDLGGHSLLVVRMINEIEDQFGAHLSLPTLFEAPTVSQLARAMGHDKGPCTIVPLRATKSCETKPPLFCIWGIFIYQELARRLNDDRPVYAIHIEAEVETLQAQPAGNGRAQEVSIPDMAARYVAQIRSIQPTGPYHLAGLSLGGLLAFEIAQQLRRQGQTTAMLAIFDTALPGAITWRRMVWARHHLAALARRGPGYLPR